MIDSLSPALASFLPMISPRANSIAVASKLAWKKRRHPYLSRLKQAPQRVDRAARLTLAIVIIIPNQKEFLFARVYSVEHRANPFRYHAFIEFCFQQPSSQMWLFLEVRTLLPDQGNKEKIERVMNPIELALLDRISQSLPFRLRPL
ncbi:hypothetical protein FXO38_34125 [Capsicum annuum]|nr:hypothetical protein FXO38_34125 [Capsicum annuum]